MTAALLSWPNPKTSSKSASRNCKASISRYHDLFCREWFDVTPSVDLVKLSAHFLSTIAFSGLIWPALSSCSAFSPAYTLLNTLSTSASLFDLIERGWNSYFNFVLLIGRPRGYSASPAILSMIHFICMFYPVFSVFFELPELDLPINCAFCSRSWRPSVPGPSDLANRNWHQHFYAFGWGLIDFFDHLQSSFENSKISIQDLLISLAKTNQLEEYCTCLAMG